MSEFHIAYGDGFEHAGTESGGDGGGAGGFDGFASRGDFEERDFCGLFIDVRVKLSGDEAMSIGIDEVAWDVFSERGSWGARDSELHGAGVPERDFGGAEDGADFESVSGGRKPSAASTPKVLTSS